MFLELSTDFYLFLTGGLEPIRMRGIGAWFSWRPKGVCSMERVLLSSVC